MPSIPMPLLYTYIADEDIPISTKKYTLKEKNLIMINFCIFYLNNGREQASYILKPISTLKILR